MKKNSLTKDEIAKNLNKKTGFSVNLSKKFINDFIVILIQNIKKSSLNIKNFGTFKIIKKNQRMGRNPKTGEIHSISPRKSLSFIASKKLSNKINLD